MSKIVLLALFLSFPVLSQEECIQLGENCHSPYLSSSKYCECLSRKSFRKGYRCYPENCVDGLSPCTKKNAA
jgi:hypothetical protein